MLGLLPSGTTSDLVRRVPSHSVVSNDAPSVSHLGAVGDHVPWVRREPSAASGDVSGSGGVCARRVPDPSGLCDVATHMPDTVGDGTQMVCYDPSVSNNMLCLRHALDGAEDHVPWCRDLALSLSTTHTSGGARGHVPWCRDLAPLKN